MVELSMLLIDWWIKSERANNSGDFFRFICRYFLLFPNRESDLFLYERAPNVELRLRAVDCVSQLNTFI